MERLKSFIGSRKTEICQDEGMGLFNVPYIYIYIYIANFLERLSFLVHFFFLFFAVTVDIGTETEIGLRRSPDMPSERATLKLGLP